MSNRSLETEFFRIDTRKDETPKFDFDIIKTFYEKFPVFVDKLPTNKRIKKSVVMDKYIDNGSKRAYVFFNPGKAIFSGKIASTSFDNVKTKIKETLGKTQNPDSDPVYEMKETQGPEKSFYFMIYYNQKEEKGFVMTESYDGLGVKGIFRGIMTDFFREEYPEYKIKFSNLLERKKIERYVKEGGITAISLMEPQISSDTASSFGVTNEFLHDFEMKLTIKPKGVKRFTTNTSKILEQVFERQQKSYILTPELKELGFGEASELKVEYSLENTKKSIIFDNPTKNFRVKEPITVSVDEYDSSNFTEINDICIDKLKKICSFCHY